MHVVGVAVVAVIEHAGSGVVGVVEQLQLLLLLLRDFSRRGRIAK